MLETRNEIKKPGNIAILRDWLTERSRESLLTYTELTYPQYIPNWHHRLIIDALEEIEAGKIDRLMILVPPRYGKSELSSIRFPAWYLGRNPDKKVMLATYNDDFARYFGKHARNLCQTPVHHLAFPDCVIRSDSSSAALWETEKGGKFVGAGRGGAVTGHGAHLLILDDLIKNIQEAYSDTVRDTIWDWYKTTLYTRLEKNASIVVVNTRWHADDLVGRLLEEEPDRWVIIELPAIAEETIDYDGYIYEQGQTLWPEKFPIETVLETKETLGTHFEPIYQQNPKAETGNIILREYWQRVKAVPGPIQRIVQSWDTGYKTKDENSYSACTTWAIIPQGYCLINAWWDKLPFPQLKRRVRDLYHQFTPNDVVIEDKASGQSLVQELQEDTRIPVKAIKPEGDKIARAHIVSPVFEGRKVYILDEQPWTGEVIDICAKFPGVQNKDIVDSITQAIEYMRLHNKPLVYHNLPASNRGKRKSIFEMEREHQQNGGNGANGY